MHLPPSRLALLPCAGHVLSPLAAFAPHIVSASGGAAIDTAASQCTAIVFAFALAAPAVMHLHRPAPCERLRARQSRAGRRSRMGCVARSCGAEGEASAAAACPRVVVAISGKRKTGKDFFYDLLMERLESRAAEVETRRFATPIKAHIARKCGLELAALETPGSFKEKFRAMFYEYDLAERAKDPFVFAREVLQDVRRPILVISDLRQIGDYDYLQKYYSDLLILIRLDANEALRTSRGYSFTAGIDDCAVECDLDPDRIQVPWTLHFENDGDDSKWLARLDAVINAIDSFLV